MGLIRAASFGGDGSAPARLRSMVVRASVSSRSTRSPRFSTRYWSLSRYWRALSGVISTPMPGMLTDPVIRMSCATANTSITNTPSSSLPPLCGYRSAMVSATQGKNGLTVRLVQTPGPTVRVSGSSRRYGP
ncbi:unannotated protein [freshwater metagenome]|uniref:Unannotated protein n=1 Tax=freshwater metagenome TaxID=449393 RepID=A0A6J6R823_9ZZZZ